MHEPIAAIRENVKGRWWLHCRLFIETSNEG